MTVGPVRAETETKEILVISPLEDLSIGSLRKRPVELLIELASSVRKKKVGTEFVKV